METHIFIKIIPQEVFKVFKIIIIFLLIVNLIGIFSLNYFGYDYFLIPLFDFDTERNIPTLYSSFALLLSSILLLIIAIIHKKYNEPYLAWAGLFIIFLFLSVDEIASIHEKLTNPTRDALDTPTIGLLRFAWIIPYSIALLIFLVSYLKFLINLSRKIRFLFILSGAIFILGALGMESIGGLAFFNSNKLIYSLVLTTEEFLEMLGIIIFIYALLVYITTEFGEISFNLKKVKSMRKI